MTFLEMTQDFLMNLIVYCKLVPPSSVGTVSQICGIFRCFSLSTRTTCSIVKSELNQVFQNQCSYNMWHLHRVLCTFTNIIHETTSFSLVFGVSSNAINSKTVEKPCLIRRKIIILLKSLLFGAFTENKNLFRPSRQSL